MKPTYDDSKIFSDWFTFKEFYRYIAKELALLDRGDRDVVIAEIGVLEGASTSFLSVELSNLGVEHMIIAHDNFAIGQWDDIKFDRQEERFLEQMRRCGVGKNIVVKKGDSSVTSSFHKDGSLDFVFVDGDHSFLGVVKDVGCFWNKLRSGGIMAGHDYISDHPFVFQFANLLNQSHPECKMQFFGHPQNVWMLRKP